MIKRRTGERRKEGRFDVVGEMRGTLMPGERSGAAIDGEAPAAIVVRLVDIGLGGVLMTLEDPPPPGARATLRLPLFPRFQSEIDVRHVTAPGAAADDARVGAAFHELSDEDRWTLQQFLMQAIN